MHELEQQPPKWLIAAIGRPPGRHGTRIAALSWRRAAIAFDDYRREHGAHLTNEALGQRPAEAEHGWTTATIPAVPGTISTGRNRSEARENVFDALRELLASPVDVPAGATREEIAVSLQFVRSQGRGHER